MLILLSVSEGQIHFHSKNRGNSDDRQRLRSVAGLMGAITNTVRTPTDKSVWGTILVILALKVPNITQINQHQRFRESRGSEVIHSGFGGPL